MLVDFLPAAGDGGGAPTTFPACAIAAAGRGGTGGALAGAGGYVKFRYIYITAIGGGTH